MGWWWQLKENPANSILAIKFWHLVVGTILIKKKKKLQSTRFHWAGLILIHNHQATAMLCLIFCMVLTRYQNAKKKTSVRKICPTKTSKSVVRVPSSTTYVSVQDSEQASMDKAAICPRRKWRDLQWVFNTGVFTSEQSKVSPCYMWVSYACTQQMAWGRPKFVPKKHHPHFKSPGLASFFFSFRSLSTCSFLYGLNVGWPCPPRFPRGDIMWYTRQTSTIAGWWF